MRIAMPGTTAVLPLASTKSVRTVTSALGAAAATVVLVAAFSSPSQASATGEVRVRLHKALNIVRVSGFELSVRRPGLLTPASASVAGDDGSRLSRDLEQVTITRTGQGLWRVRWSAGGPAEDVEADRLLVRGQMLRLGKEPVPYEIELHENPKTGVDVVTRLETESYLAGVLPAEMPVEWPLEALKAQAVAARSFVVRSRFERRRQHFDVDATIADQVYKFLRQAEEQPRLKSKLERALAETKDEVLIDDRRRVVKAFYSADCGCRTEDPRFVWGKSESFQSVEDPSCSSHRTQSWSFVMNRGEILGRLNGALALPPGTDLKALHIGGRTPSGRVRSVVAAFSIKGQEKALNINFTAQDFRSIFGFSRIRSTDFGLHWFGELMEVRGSGVGHGVGLCQTGAQSLASKGMTYRDILRLYYPKARVFRRPSAT